MKTRGIILAGVGAIALLQPVIASAQTTDDVLVMRRVITKKGLGGNTPTPSGPTPENPGPLTPVDGSDLSAYYWVTSGWYQVQGCGDVQLDRLVGCVKSGNSADESLCPQPKPTATQASQNYESCSFSWEITGYGDWSSTCSATAKRNPLVQCKRADGTVVGSDQCAGIDLPDAQISANYTSCTYDWVPGTYGEWSTTCGTNATRTMSVTCKRSNGVTVPDANCTEPKPPTTETADNYSGCQYSWEPGTWSVTTPSCSLTAPMTRSVTCMRSDGSSAQKTPVADTACTDEKPATFQTGSDYTNCSYHWEYGDWGDWSDGCSAGAVKQRAATCVREDGQPAQSSSCDITTKEATQESGANYSGCGYDWKTGAWSAAPVCAPSTTITRAVTCERSDKTVVTDESLCTETRPAATNVTEAYVGCGYEWITGTWSDWDQTCSTTANSTRSVVCHRSSGENVDDALCAAVGEKPPTVKTGTNPEGCSVGWETGEWGDWSNTCSDSATRSRPVTCYRTGPGSAHDAATSCDPATKPASTETASIQTGCSVNPAAWVQGPWSATSSTCSATAVQTRSVLCQRLETNGTYTTLPDASCTEEKPAASQVLPDMTGCQYEWAPQDWKGDWSSTCSMTATQTRDMKCNQVDPSTGIKTDVPLQECSTHSASGEGNTVSVPAQHATDCGGALVNGGFESGMSGWTVGNTKPTYINSPYIISTAKIGSAAVGFPASIGGGQSGTLSVSQDITTKAIEYNLSYWCYGPSGSSVFKGVWKAGGVSKDIKCTLNSAAWYQQSAVVTGSGGTDTLTFAISNSTTSSFRLDEVLLTPIVP